MSYTIQVFLKSSDFSQEYADLNHNGEDSPENIRFEWEDEFRINGHDLIVEVVHETSYNLEGELPDNTSFNYKIEPVIVFEFASREGITPLVFSTQILDEYFLDEDEKSLKIYLNDDEVVENPVSGVYLGLSHFPKELRG